MFFEEFFRVLCTPHPPPSSVDSGMNSCQKAISNILTWARNNFFGSRLACSSFWHSEKLNILPELDRISWKMRANLKHLRDVLIFQKISPGGIIQYNDLWPLRAYSWNARWYFLGLWYNLVSFCPPFRWLAQFTRDTLNNWISNILLWPRPRGHDSTTIPDDEIVTTKIQVRAQKNLYFCNIYFYLDEHAIIKLTCVFSTGNWVI